MKQVRMFGVVALAVALALVFARPMEASPQEPATAQMASDLEAAAGDLHGRADRWDEAARLYVVAADLRQQEDPEARQDLFKAASLYFALGRPLDALAALESAASRALTGGALAEARFMLDRAAWVARSAGLTLRERRLTDRATQVADAFAAGRYEVASS
jgi:hypothetical protein